MALYYDVTINTEWISGQRRDNEWRVAVPAGDNAEKFGELLGAVLAANGWAVEHGWVYRMTTARKMLHRRPPNAMTYSDFRGAVL